jgi:methylenetetrahydrofolate reductase (NADPH)
MHISEILANGPTCSFEFFPPKTAKGAENLYGTIQQLEGLKPSFVSVTYGAGGSTRDLTHDLVVRIKDSTSLDPIPHLTVVCHDENEIRSILERYAGAGVSNILALGGDPPADWFASFGDSTTKGDTPLKPVSASGSRAFRKATRPHPTG